MNERQQYYHLRLKQTKRNEWPWRFVVFLLLSFLTYIVLEAFAGWLKGQ